MTILTDIEGTTSSISFVKGEGMRLADALKASAASPNARPWMAGPGDPQVAHVAPWTASWTLCDPSRNRE